MKDELIEEINKLNARIATLTSKNKRLQEALQNCADYWPSALNDDLQTRTWEEANVVLEATRRG